MLPMACLKSYYQAGKLEEVKLENGNFVFGHVAFARDIKTSFRIHGSKTGDDGEWDYYTLDGLLSFLRIDGGPDRQRLLGYLEGDKERREIQIEEHVMKKDPLTSTPNKHQKESAKTLKHKFESVFSKKKYYDACQRELDLVSASPLKTSVKSDYEQKALDLVAKAEKKLASSKTLGGLFGGSSKQYKALELYERAGNLFKTAKNWSSAGNTFSTLAQHHLEVGNKLSAALQYVEASNCHRKTDPAEAASCLVKAAEMHADMGSFTIAANHHSTIAGIYEDDLHDFNRAMQHVQLAADYFYGEECGGDAYDRSMFKVAQYAARLENYDSASQIFEKMAGNTTKGMHDVNDCFFRAAICHLCVDVLDAKRALQEQYPADFAAAHHKEVGLVRALCVHVDNQDAEGFAEEVRQYERILKLDPWCTALLLRIMEKIGKERDMK